ncbi:MAG: hypothetical protein MET45_06665 [Nostoc sp. LLA-1]|nr:hypothetical protein [Cyanocohniella sp. LLY]
MTATYNLPDGDKILHYLRLINFITLPVKYVENFAKVYVLPSLFAQHPPDRRAFLYHTEKLYLPT